MHQIIQKFYGFQICANVFASFTELLASLWFSQNKSHKFYPGPMLPPIDRNFQLIYSNWRTNFSLSDKTWTEFSTLEVAECTYAVREKNNLA
jgi:hypothetical protein